MCTVHTGKRNSCKTVATGAATPPSVSQRSRSLQATVILSGHLSESNWETVVVTKIVGAIAMIGGRGRAATHTAVTLPGASQI